LKFAGTDVVVDFLVYRSRLRNKFWRIPAKKKPLQVEKPYVTVMKEKMYIKGSN